MFLKDLVQPSSFSLGTSSSTMESFPLNKCSFMLTDPEESSGGNDKEGGHKASPYEIIIAQSLSNYYMT